MGNEMWLDIHMTNNTNSNCSHENLMVTGGTVRCSDCPKWFHDHKDSQPRPGLVSSNQER